MRVAHSQCPRNRGSAPAFFPKDNSGQILIRAFWWKTVPKTYIHCTISPLASCRREHVASVKMRSFGAIHGLKEAGRILLELLPSLGKVFRSKIFKDVKENSNLIMFGQVSGEKMYREWLSKERFSVLLKLLSWKKIPLLSWENGC